MTLIDPRAIVDPKARLAADVQVGPWSIIGPDVEIGEGTVIGPHVILKGPTVIGRHNRIFQFSSIGEDTPTSSIRANRPGCGSAITTPSAKGSPSIAVPCRIGKRRPLAITTC